MASATYPYVTVAGSFRKFLKDLPSYGRPDKVTQKWLEGVGFRSTNDRRIISVIKFVGLVSSDGVPTDLWLRYRGAEGRAAFAEAVRTAYAPLFQTFPDAHRRDPEALLNFFRANTDLADKAARLCVLTFQILCEYGDWDSDPPEDMDLGDAGEKEDEKQNKREKKPPRPRVEPSAPGGLTLNINIQLQLPANADGDTYEQLFAAMGKHLKDLGGGLT